ncbi:hypothetical protein B1U23_05755 (plasmid) [Borreliella burgdorferi]|uniref:Uncharacterized protein n=2 Tax=Borreliella burgdorferi TaxID=139 RepID=O50837_BORBU|nr:conserved hypothetical protein [Borreliella burgdorferi B31]ACN56189.1 conserved hypothetical protein [Borreliella burgdorferi CA-11.2A]ADQ31268.1 conserved hypothetical protein [Borreliella burgdorferi JD1]ADQ44489.1 conserved hypothetical protein [Borreliella burgdorferi 297]ARS30864.1 hypothetical protein B1U23_05755 [Borreliella burgdorferi]
MKNNGPLILWISLLYYLIREKFIYHSILSLFFPLFNILLSNLNLLDIYLYKTIEFWILYAERLKLVKLMKVLI